MVENAERGVKPGEGRTGVKELVKRSTRFSMGFRDDMPVKGVLVKARNRSTVGRP